VITPWVPWRVARVWQAPGCPRLRNRADLVRLSSVTVGAATKAAACILMPEVAAGGTVLQTSIEAKPWTTKIGARAHAHCDKMFDPPKAIMGRWIAMRAQLGWNGG
jgi:hypothetical protein